MPWSVLDALIGYESVKGLKSETHTSGLYEIASKVMHFCCVSVPLVRNELPIPDLKGLATGSMNYGYALT